MLWECIVLVVGTLSVDFECCVNCLVMNVMITISMHC